MSWWLLTAVRCRASRRTLLRPTGSRFLSASQPSRSTCARPQTGHIVVMHDDTVDRTTNGTSEVGRMTLTEIKSLDAGCRTGAAFADQRDPTYEEVLEALPGPGTKMVLGIKPGEALDNERVVWLTEQFGAVLDVVVGPRSMADLRDFKRPNPDLRTLARVPGQTDPRPLSQPAVQVPDDAAVSGLPSLCVGFDGIRKDAAAG